MQDIKKKVEEIDLDKLIRSQKNKLVRNLPQFIVNYIKRLVHLEEINQVIRNNQDKFGFDFVKGCVDHLNLTVKTFNDKILPKSGRFIFAANHPLGAVDFGAVIGKFVGDRMAFGVDPNLLSAIFGVFFMIGSFVILRVGSQVLNEESYMPAIVAILKDNE